MYTLIIAGYASADRSVNIVVLSSDELVSTQRTLRGAKKSIEQKFPQVNFTDFVVSSNPDENLSIIESSNKINPDLILTVGSSATQFAQENFENKPIVFSAVKYPVLSGFVKSLARPGGNTTGASIDIPVDVQFNKFRQIIPDLKKIGVLYSDNTESLIPHAKIIAQNLGFELVAIKVNSERELSPALDSLCNTVQGIWSLADNNLFNAKSTRFILLNTIRHSIPFMGFSRYVVESGALFALDFDFKAVGLQAGEIVNRILEGEKPGDITVTSVEFIYLHINEKTSKRINVPIPNELLAVAKEVYR